ncbi:NUDIX domain-containing protein [Angustibacter sp. McL0619]|uniref:NUDIX domain-containing protein n=1 Tax=Angustibacter sp. McL0619 TaxID=3415676 RepID=UPI003CF5D873
MSERELADTFTPNPVSSSEVAFEGMVWDVRREAVDLGRAGTVTREFLDHPGAVGVLALDDAGRVALVHQYRHPVGMTLWELPAGLLDVEGEPPLLAAQRELAEEADLQAGRWDVLIDWLLSPGGTSEAFRCYLARDLSPVPEHARHQRHGEELDMPTVWFDLDEVHAAVLANRLSSPTLVVGVLAAHAGRVNGWSTLQPADTPWPEHPRLRPKS